jgi:secondary thiamine-phosphate synthase enzyme
MHSEKLRVATTTRSEFVDITEAVASVVRGSGIADGLCTVFVTHTTAGITINENADPSVVGDMLAYLARLVPRDSGFRHAEGNSDSHIKASVVGSSVTVPFTRGKLMLGTWQGVYFCEFDGPRTRSYVVAVNGNSANS